MNKIESMLDKAPYKEYTNKNLLLLQQQQKKKLESIENELKYNNEIPRFSTSEGPESILGSSISKSALSYAL